MPTSDVGVPKSLFPTGSCQTGGRQAQSTTDCQSTTD